MAKGSYHQIDIPEAAENAYQRGEVNTLREALSCLHNTSPLSNMFGERIYDYTKMLLSDENSIQVALSLLENGIENDALEHKEIGLSLIIKNAPKIELKGLAALMLEKAYKKTDYAAQKDEALDSLVEVASQATAIQTQVETYDFVISSPYGVQGRKQEAAEKLIQAVSTCDNQITFLKSVSKAQKLLPPENEMYQQARTILKNGKYYRHKQNINFALHIK